VCDTDEVVDADFKELEEVGVVRFEQGLQFVRTEGQVGVDPGVRVRGEGAQEELVHGVQHACLEFMRGQTADLLMEEMLAHVASSFGCGAEKGW
jgi:hypothetical protein